MPTNSRRVLHFTHGKNLPAILAARELRCDAAAQPVCEIGDPGIKSRRECIRVPCAPGGFVSDYVPFYFAPRSPMLGSLVTGADPRVPQEHAIIYLEVSVDSLEAANAQIVYANGNAAHRLTRFAADPTNLDPPIDWPLMAERFWANTEDDPDRQRRRQAELLAHDVVPVRCIERIITKRPDVAARVEAILAGASLTIPVVTMPSWYFKDPA